MVAISLKSYNKKRKRKLLELHLKESVDENSDCESSLSSSNNSIESGFYDDEANHAPKSSDSLEDTSDVHNDVPQFDSVLQSTFVGNESEEEEKEEDSEDEEINEVVNDVHQFDSMLVNPVEELDSSSEDEADLEDMAGELLQLLSDSSTAGEERDDREVSVLQESNFQFSDNPELEEEAAGEERDDREVSALQESNFQFSDSPELEEEAVLERVDRAVASTDSLVTVEVEETGDVFALNTPDLRAQTFLHKVDKPTFDRQLDTLAEINMYRLAGWQGNVTYERSKKRGGLRACFTQDMQHFEEVHRRSVKRLHQTQAAAAESRPVQLSSLTARNPPKPKLTHYQDFIALR